tara:strand:+ start:1614 stop:3392 length:1779 start_codon:yes stop_codon:yes gene_type:complete
MIKYSVGFKNWFFILENNTMTDRLKTLYKHLIIKNQHQIKGWYDGYKSFHNEVEAIRKRLNDGGQLDPENDEEFLRKLIYNNDGQIASRGQSVLSNNNFQKFIKEPSFMNPLRMIIKEPDKENFKKFKEAWGEQTDFNKPTKKAGNNPVLINRVAAACTTEVSTTVDGGKFNQVFNWLIKENLIEDYPESEDKDCWFSKNLHLMSEIHKKFKEELDNQDTDEYYLSIFIWELYENIAHPFSLKKQTVKYGAPGTGKTFTAKRQAEFLFNIWKDEFDSNKIGDFQINDVRETVQFHPSYSYEDFIEGLRPIPVNGVVELKLHNGVFKEFCRKAAKWEIDVSKLGDKISKKWEDLTIDDLLPYKHELSGDHWKYIFDYKVTSKNASDAVPPYFFIIDEINRAELSRVFGELMYCFEYRGIDGSIKTQYSNLNNNETGMIQRGSGYQFFIPHNVYLIGTMNTIDRSIESFDFALRRRFQWEEIMPDTKFLQYNLLENSPKWRDLAENLESLNQSISNEPLLGRDYQIGHAYLMDLKYPKNLTVNQVREMIWKDSIHPLLQEYLRGTGKEQDLLDSFKEAFSSKRDNKSNIENDNG